MKTKEIVIFGLLAAILLVCQIGLAFLPNIELVSILVIVYTLVYRKKVFFIIYPFVLAEGLIYGFGLWWISYLYIWSILAIAVLLLKKEYTVTKIALLSGTFGISFGFLCSLPYFAVGKWSMGFAYFVAGIPYDIIHCIGNVAAARLLYRILYRNLEKLQKIYLLS